MEAKLLVDLPLDLRELVPQEEPDDPETQAPHGSAQASIALVTASLKRAQLDAAVSSCLRPAAVSE